MSGHSKWAGIKHQKAIMDKKRATAFSKLLTAITAASKSEPDPNFNPRLRTAIEKAKAEQVPADNIARAIKRAAETGKNIEELVLEAYGPGGAAILIEATTDNRNRTVAEIKHLLSEEGGKWAESGSVRWAFEQAPLSNPPHQGERKHTEDTFIWKAKFPQEFSADDKQKLGSLIAALEGHADVQRVYTNVR